MRLTQPDSISKLSARVLSVYANHRLTRWAERMIDSVYVVAHAVALNCPVCRSSDTGEQSRPRIALRSKRFVTDVAQSRVSIKPPHATLSAMEAAPCVLVCCSPQPSPVKRNVSRSTTLWATGQSTVIGISLLPIVFLVLRLTACDRVNTAKGGVGIRSLTGAFAINRAAHQSFTNIHNTQFYHA